ncbi:hypothetical protein [Syntrophorhabdus aromaticivorans]|uniref:hypothetical protein n=1 Tax=Syntrophorhabdus aromaticivorans TaxID=328301 RepID=UPI00041EBD8B|nr:hypothetical protein [Syntrophorhabdus aromaticivorans]
MDYLPKGVLEELHPEDSLIASSSAHRTALHLLPRVMRLARMRSFFKSSTLRFGRFVMFAMVRVFTLPPLPV